MKQLNKKVAVADWKTCLVALIAGLIITIVAWCFTHISFLLTWLAITVGSIPVWAQVVEWARARYPHMLLDEALFCYLFMKDESYDDEDFEEDCDNLSLDD